MTPLRNPFKNIGDHVIQKCIKAFFKIKDFCEPLGQVPLFLALHFYNTLILPLMDYCSGVWYNQSIVNLFEKFSLKYFRRALHVRPNMPTLSVYGKFGIHRVGIRLKCNVLKYLHRLHNLPHSVPAYLDYLDLCTLSVAGFDTWVSRALNIYNLFETETGITKSRFLDLLKHSVKDKIKVAFYKSYDVSMAVSDQ